MQDLSQQVDLSKANIMSCEKCENKTFKQTDKNCSVV